MIMFVLFVQILNIQRAALLHVEHFIALYFWRNRDLMTAKSFCAELIFLLSQPPYKKKKGGIIKSERVIDSIISVGGLLSGRAAEFS